jgi:outer membrane assembly lipoprotein YfiO
MKKFFIISIFALLCLSILADNAMAFWVWTPKTEKWINPKYAPKDTPEKQYDYAMDFYENGEYKKAATEFDKLINSFEGSSLVPDAGYYGGLSYEKTEDYYKAYLIYNKIISQYPKSKRNPQIIEQMYNIGVLFLNGAKRKIMGLEVLPALTTSQQIFLSIITHAPYSAFGDDAQFQLGQAYKKMGNYNMAVEAFGDLLKKYAESPLVGRAQYEIAICSLQASKPAAYEQETTEKAIKEFEDFIEESPPDDLRQEAQKTVIELQSRKAKHEYDIAKYYESRREYASALIYYKAVVNDYPETEWATLSENQIKIIQEKVDKKTK